MAQLPGSAFLKGRDRIVRISETGNARAVQRPMVTVTRTLLIPSPLLTTPALSSSRV